MYLVFARKYRPQRFEEVVGQTHVSRTLQNAVRNDRVAHAYLFCGSRGVGKTSMARILAKALNCKEGPTPEPCGKCESCRRIAIGEDLDVMEIDGASNRGINEIRELRQNVRYAPAHSRYKIYYVDEVHMLTQQAFNALLKTLEEPPEHVKFIFSTTDPQQLPETVKSRCQRFDFRRISDAAIVGHLRSICQKEGLEPEKGSLQTIARAARGSLRDALSTLDQIAAFSAGHVRTEDVLMVLGAARTQSLTQVVDALAEEQTGRALSLMREVLFSGVDLIDFVDQLSEYLRDLLVTSYCEPDDELLAGAAADAETLGRQAALFSPEQIIYMVQVLREAKLRARRDTTGRLALELAIVKLSRLSDLIPLEETLKESQSRHRERATAPPDGPGGEQPSAPSRIQNMMRKLQNRGASSAKAAQSTAPRRTEEEKAPEWMNPRSFRQIQNVAEDRALAEEVAQDEPLLRAFVEADEQFGVQPDRLRRSRTGKGEKPRGETSAGEPVQ